MNILCLDCQQFDDDDMEGEEEEEEEEDDDECRHDIYKEQFRAMFVLNCVVIRSEKHMFKEKKKGQKKVARLR